MNSVNTYRLDLSKSRKYEYFPNMCKYIFIPTPYEGVFLSFTDNGYLFDVSKINEYYFKHGIEGFYISNTPQEGILYLITVNCGLKFQDVYSFLELKKIINDINANWKRLLEAET
ncbi:MAG TPA: hypothetical protein DCG38_05075 [Eubacteriaceae bacterium]|nr:hypothetical protein [Eubacteriaceae bacterium]